MNKNKSWDRVLRNPSFGEWMLNAKQSPFWTKHPSSEWSWFADLPVSLCPPSGASGSWATASSFLLPLFSTQGLIGCLGSLNKQVLMLIRRQKPTLKRVQRSVSIIFSSALSLHQLIQLSKKCHGLGGKTFSQLSRGKFSSSFFPLH